jgi:hypothetical protein
LTEKTPTGDFFDRHEWALLALVFVAAVVAVVTRRPDAITSPQFYVEDGGFVYAGAHEHGLLSLVTPWHRGYLIVLPRLAAVAALPFPILHAPLVMNSAAILAQGVVAAFIASSRLETLIRPRAGRLALAFFYVALPAAWTLMGNATHMMWHLFLLAALVIAARPPAGRAGKLFDAGAVALTGLSGPGSLLLAPVAGAAWWRRRDRWSLVLFAIVAATAAVQALFVALFGAADAERPFLNASVWSFLLLTVRRIVYETVVGQVGLAAWVDGSGFWNGPVAVGIAFALAVAVVAVALWKGPFEIWLLAGFAALVYASSLWWPPTSVFTEQGYWGSMMFPPDGNRYFFLPAFVLVLSLVWMACSERVALRAVGVAALGVVLVMGVRLDWREPPLRDFEWPRYAAAYERAAPGERVQIPNPPNYSFILTKR